MIFDKIKISPFNSLKNQVMRQIGFRTVSLFGGGNNEEKIYYQNAAKILNLNINEIEKLLPYFRQGYEISLAIFIRQMIRHMFL